MAQCDTVTVKVVLVVRCDGVVVVVVVVVVVGHYEAHSRVSVYQPTFTYWWRSAWVGLDRNCQQDYKT